MKVSIVTPTFNEADNILAFLNETRQKLSQCDYEVIVVDDDSPDLTWKVAAEIANRDPRVRVLRRIGQRGLGNSVIDGFRSSVGDALTCIDADMQHDPAVIPAMAAALERGCDMAIASRYVAGGGTGKWSVARVVVSKMATLLAKVFLGTRVQDPMSGYFMIRREGFRRVSEQIDGTGFKIMLEILVHLRPRSVAEIPYTFRSRLAGDSKLSGSIILSYLRQLIRLSNTAGRFPMRPMKFAAVGFAGIVVNLCVMASLIRFAGLRDWRASTLSTLAAMTTNFLFNNGWTFSDRKIRGRRKLLAGYASYSLISLAGLVVTTAAYAAITATVARTFGLQHANFLPDSILVLAQIVSITFGAFTNYVLNTRITWRPALRPCEQVPVHEIGTERDSAA